MLPPVRALAGASVRHAPARRARVELERVDAASPQAAHVLEAAVVLLMGSVKGRGCGETETRSRGSTTEGGPHVRLVGRTSL